ncbi:MAG: GatB/YqeY domain-containing protein [Candidatus Shapirobacteria bacterium]
MLLARIKTDLVSAVKSRDEARLLVLRFLLSEIHNREIELRGQKKELTDEILFSLIKKEVKRRQEAFAAFQQGKRPELAAKELAEQKILIAYLPITKSLLD